jgi:hypothetical protein
MDMKLPAYGQAHDSRLMSTGELANAVKFSKIPNPDFVGRGRKKAEATW